MAGKTPGWDKLTCTIERDHVCIYIFTKEDFCCFIHSFKVLFFWSIQLILFFNLQIMNSLLVSRLHNSLFLFIQFNIKEKISNMKISYFSITNLLFINLTNRIHCKKLFIDFIKPINILFCFINDFLIFFILGLFTSFII